MAPRVAAGGSPCAWRRGRPLAAALLLAALPGRLTRAEQVAVEVEPTGRSRPRHRRHERRAGPLAEPLAAAEQRGSPLLRSESPAGGSPRPSGAVLTQTEVQGRAGVRQRRHSDVSRDDPAEEPKAEEGAEGGAEEGAEEGGGKNKMVLASAGGGVLLLIVGSAVGYYYTQKSSKNSKGKGKGKGVSAAGKEAAAAASQAAQAMTSKSAKDAMKTAGSKAAAAGAGAAAAATKAVGTAAKSKAKARAKGKHETKAEPKETPGQDLKETMAEPKETSKPDSKKETSKPDSKKEKTALPAVEKTAEEENLVVDPVVLKAALRIQAYFRGWKARKLVAGVRTWKPNQKVCLFIECINGKDMPSVNTFGGCDPYVEFRLVQGQDPLLHKGGCVTTQAPNGMSVKTEADDGNSEPTWNAKFELKEVPLRKDQFLQVILWDKNTFTDTPIGHQTFMVEKLLEGLTFVAGTEQPKRNSRKVSFKSLLEEGVKLTATVQTKFSYVDMVNFNFRVAKGSRLPNVKLLGAGINSFVELRMVTEDPKKIDFEYSPPSTCLWSSKTRIVQGNTDPKFDQNFEVVVPAIAALKLQAIIWDSNSPLPDSPICHSVMDLSGVVAEMAQVPKENKLKFTHLPAVSPAGDVRKTTLTVAIGVSQIFDQGKDED
ncbi:unnamed protein product [Prorocentrum cordatum]|uniref:C2 domain-containing protein n=1 Tax=Prorocentrum cordatum TaxID=2364126 RepID=A0ABN9WIP6_9DINO|nr:unnamed protein product [Polarella glacialis]|mmetsp:Transcript_89655/g.237166  ORF Transcript_89655/g.237166 Transcript_89655/m.237166 type:complete len:656 (+) Transcript_89655:63-2030(+)